MNTSQDQKHDTSPTPRALTQSEIESLRQEMKESLAIIRKLVERDGD